VKLFTLTGVLLTCLTTASLAATTNSDIIEFRLQGGWIQADLSNFTIDGAPTPVAGDLFPYVTRDGVPRIVYRGTDSHIHELRLQGGWIQADLSQLVTNGTPVPAAGDPFPYVTPEGIPRIVYRGTDFHIHELRLQGAWLQADLSNIVVNGPPIPAGQFDGDPFAYVTLDGVARVLYQGQDAHIHEFRLQGAWLQADLSALSGNPPPPADGHVFAYVTVDGIPRVIYRGVEEDIHELRLQGSWLHTDLTQLVNNIPLAPLAIGAPFGYVTPDGTARVVYIGNDFHVHELHLQGGWIPADLSALTADQTPGEGNVFAYVTPDGVPRVLYRGDDSNIHELRLQGSWIGADLSNFLLDPPAILAGGNPRAYVSPGDQIPRLVFRSVP
jgi:hypothetical protein